jgi:hypothetical protein
LVVFSHGRTASRPGCDEGALLDEVVTAFFDRYLNDDPRPLTELPDRVHESGLATFASHSNLRLRELAARPT